MHVAYISLNQANQNIELVFGFMSISYSKAEIYRRLPLFYYAVLFPVEIEVKEKMAIAPLKSLTPKIGEWLLKF